MRVHKYEFINADLLHNSALPLPRPHSTSKRAGTHPYRMSAQHAEPLGRGGKAPMLERPMPIRHIERGCQRAQLRGLHFLQQHHITVRADDQRGSGDVETTVTLEIPRHDTNMSKRSGGASPSG